MGHNAWTGKSDQIGGDEEDGLRAHGVGKSVAFDQFDTTTYLHSDNAADGSFVEHLILQVNGSELSGAPVELPGFGTHYGMYFLIDATGHGSGGATAAFDSMNIALMVDRGNNDGTPSSTEQGIGFSNGTHGDFALATGMLKSAGIVVGADGTFHPQFVQDITPTEAGERIFGASLDASAILQELLTTPAGPTSFDEGSGNTINVVNGVGRTGLPATGIITLDPQTSLSVRPGLLSHEPCGLV